MEPDWIHLSLLRELAEPLAKLLSIIDQQSWLSGEVPVNWRLANMMSVYRKGWKEESGNYGSVILSTVLEKLMDQIILGTITQHLKDNQVIRPIQ